MTDEHKTMMRTKQMIYEEKRSKEAKKKIMTDANKRFDAMLRRIGDRIYVGLRQNAKEVWIGISGGVWKESNGILVGVRWESGNARNSIPLLRSFSQKDIKM